MKMPKGACDTHMVVGPGVPDAELERLAKAGVCAVCIMTLHVDRTGKFLEPVQTGSAAFRSLPDLVDTGRFWVANGRYGTSYSSCAAGRCAATSFCCRCGGAGS